MVQSIFNRIIIQYFNYYLFAREFNAPVCSVNQKYSDYGDVILALSISQGNTMKLKQTVIIHANAETLFDLTQDYDKRKLWDTLMGDIQLLGELPIQKGTQLKYTANNGFSMIVEYQNYKRPTIASIKMISTSLLFAEFAGGWRFEPLDDTHTKITLAYHIKARFLPRLTTPILVKLFAKENQKRFDTLKQFIENQ